MVNSYKNGRKDCFLLEINTEIVFCSKMSLSGLHQQWALEHRHEKIFSRNFEITINLRKNLNEWVDDSFFFNFSIVIDIFIRQLKMKSYQILNPPFWNR